jgi:hypothetical protein
MALTSVSAFFYCTLEHWFRSALSTLCKGDRIIVRGFDLDRNTVGSSFAQRSLTCVNAPNTRVMPSDFGITRSLDVRLSFHTKESADYEVRDPCTLEGAVDYQNWFGSNESRTSKKAFGSKFGDPKAVFGAFRPKPVTPSEPKGPTCGVGNL